MYLLERHFVKDEFREKFMVAPGQIRNGSITITFISFLKIKSIVLVLVVLQRLVIRVTADIKLVIIIVI
jgi:hypothetical protein